MSYPNSIDSFGTPAGTSLLSSPDHALDHRTLGSVVGTLQGVLGTTAGTGVLKNFAAGDFPARVNSSNVLQHRVSGTVDNAIVGTPSVNGGTIANAQINTTTISSGTMNAEVIGTPAITGGTANGIVLGTPTIGTVTVPGTVAALSFSAAIAPGVGSVADAAGGTMTINAQQGQVFISVLGTAAGNRTIGTPLNPTGYQQITYGFKSSGSENATAVWPSGAFTLSQDTGTPAFGTGLAWTWIGWRYNQLTSKWQFQGQSANII